MTRCLKVIAVVMLLLSYLWPSGGAGARAAQQREYRRPDIVGDQTPYDARFGPDDNAAFAIHFSGDIHGNLEPCG